jgi:hypothetical protein
VPDSPLFGADLACRVGAAVTGLLAAIMLGALMVELSPSPSWTLQDEERSV